MAYPCEIYANTAYKRGFDRGAYASRSPAYDLFFQPYPLVNNQFPASINVEAVFPVYPAVATPTVPEPYVVPVPVAQPYPVPVEEPYPVPYPVPVPTYNPYTTFPSNPALNPSPYTSYPSNPAYSRRVPGYGLGGFAPSGVGAVALPSGYGTATYPLRQPATYGGGYAPGGGYGPFGSLRSRRRPQRLYDPTTVQIIGNPNAYFHPDLITQPGGRSHNRIWPTRLARRYV